MVALLKIDCNQLEGYCNNPSKRGGGDLDQEGSSAMLRSGWILSIYRREITEFSDRQIEEYERRVKYSRVLAWKTQEQSFHLLKLGGL